MASFSTGDYIQRSSNTVILKHSRNGRVDIPAAVDDILPSIRSGVQRRVCDLKSHLQQHFDIPLQVLCFWDWGSWTCWCIYVVGGAGLRCSTWCRNVFRTWQYNTILIISAHSSRSSSCR